MEIKSGLYAAVLLTILSLLPLPFAAAQYAGENVNISGNQEHNVYAAGSNVLVSAEVDGDVVVAGGRVDITNKVSGDILAAGGTVNLHAQVLGDIRAVGGQVSVDGSVDGDTVAAGGTVTVSPQSVVKGRAWLAGGEVNMNGRLAKSFAAAGGVLNISGSVNGDAELRGERINILPGASIEGQLNYYSPNEANIDPKAHIGGKIVFHQVKSEKPSVAVIIGFGLVFIISLLIAGIVLYLLFPQLTFATIKTARTDAGKSIALGLALFITIPFTAMVLFSLVIGSPLALIVLAVYFVFLVSSFLIVAFFIGDALLRVIGFIPENSKGLAIAALAVGLVIVGVVLLIPVLGVLLVLIAQLFALGALSIKIYQMYGTLRGAKAHTV